MRHRANQFRLRRTLGGYSTAEVDRAIEELQGRLDLSEAEMLFVAQEVQQLIKQLAVASATGWR